MAATTILKVIGLILALLAVLAVLPLALIFSLNTLFELEIPIALKTWAAAFFLLLLLFGRGSK
jgi:hypothetical protein